MLNEKLNDNNNNNDIIEVKIGQEKEYTTKEIRIGMIHASLASLLYGTNTCIIKLTKELCPEKFTSFNFCFWRGLSTTIVLLFVIRKEEPDFKLFENIKCRNWLLIRSIGFYVSFILSVVGLLLLRVSLAQVISSIAPVVALIVAVFVLHETFYLRYLIGIILCFIGSAIIVLNENTNNEETVKDMTSFYFGILACLLKVIILGVVNVSQKVLMDNGMSNKHQILYVSLAMLICSTIICLFNWKFGFNIWIIALSMTNGCFYFFANHFVQESLRVLKVGGCVAFNYLQTIFVFILSVIILKEPLFLTDIVGSLIIVSFHGYNSCNPIKH